MRKLAVLLVLVFTCQTVQATFVVPDTSTGYINDYANVISEETKKNLEEELRTFAASTTNEIAVVVVPSLDGEVIERYATKIFDKWKIGDENKDNGVLLLVAVEDRQLRIEVGYGLEGALPDILAKDIINTKILPSFKEKDYDTGIISGVNAIMEAIRGEYSEGNGKEAGSLESVIVAIFFFGIFVLQFLGAILARSKSWWAGGVIGGILGGGGLLFGVFGTSLILGGFITLILIVLGLLFDYIVSNTYKQSVVNGSSIPWWAGGGSGSRSSSSFGGFGGGSSGGGGASGSW